MQITKTKTYNQIPLSELKEFLQIDQSDVSQDGLIKRLLKTAIEEAEQYLNDDIIFTTSVLEENNYLATFCYLTYQLPATSNVRISSIQISSGFGTGATLTTVSGSDYALEKFNNYTNIIFNSSISGTRLLITYTSGLAAIPETIKTAIYMKVGSYLDVERNGYVSTSMNNVKAFERLLQPYVNNIY